MTKKKLTISLFFSAILPIIPVLCLIAPVTAQPFIQYPDSDFPPQYRNTLVVKLRPGASPDIKDITGDLPVKMVRKVLNKKENAFQHTRSGSMPFYHHVWEIHLKDEASVKMVLQDLQRDPRVDYAEPSYSYQLLYMPDDPESQPASGRQTYLSQIKAYQAWDLERNHNEPVIAVVDTGLDTAHADIRANLYLNTDDPINGVDDDGDGYTDNYYGWDFADEDPDITADNDDHGTRVSGISNAVTNNDTGIAGTAFNARLLPLKAFTSASNEFANGFDAVIYAAEMGSDIIILSWGSADAYSEYAQEVINYVVNDLDVVVIAAAGNTSGEYDFYPASYDNVLSVGAVDGDDNLADWASYSTYIDLVAPGVNVYSTVNDNAYGSADGSSFTAPMVAGTASLLKMRFPGWNARQIMEQIRVSTDNIYSVGNNVDYHEKMGTGRLNMYKALADTMGVSVRMSSYNYTNGIGPYAFFDDTLRFSMQFINYLASVEDLKIRISSEHPSADPLENFIEVSELTTLDSIPDSLGAFSLLLNDDLGYNEKIKVRIFYESNGYSDYQYFELYSSGSSFDIFNNSLRYTVSDKGHLGFTGMNYSTGNGILFKDEQILNNFGIILSKDKQTVSDNALYNIIDRTGNNDFIMRDKIKLYKNSRAFFDARNTFEEQEYISNRTGIHVEQKILSNKTSPFIICEYRLINLGDSIVHGLNFGLLADWDLDDPEQNRAGWMPGDSLGIVCNNDSSLFTGIGFHGNPGISFYAMDLDNFNGNMADVDTVISDSIKHQLVSGGIQKTAAGVQGMGNDVAMVTGVRIDSLKPWAAEKLAFYIVVDSTLEGLKERRAEARNYYRNYLSSPPVDTSYYICRGENVTINPPGGDMFEFYEDPYGDILLATDSVIILNQIYGDSDVYVVNIDNNYRGDIRRIPVIIDEPEAGFTTVPDTLIINQGESGTVKFIDKSSNSDQWEWDFGNGYGSTLQFPDIDYEAEGNYEVLQVVENQTGCEDSLYGQVVVIYKNEIPEVEDRSVCRYTDVTVQAMNTDSINVYEDSLMTELIHSGSTLIIMDIKHNEKFWITNVEGEYESDPVKLDIYVSNLNSEMGYQLDTQDITTIKKLLFSDRSTGNSTRQWFVDGTFHTDDSLFSFDYDGFADFSVKLLAEDSTGCRDSSIQVFIPSLTPVPEVEPQRICQGDTAVFQTSRNSVMSVYTDPSLSERIFKGRQPAIPNITQDTSFYVTALDSLLESLPTEVFINVSVIEAGFTMDPDTLNLQEGNEVRFTALTEAGHYFWEFELNGTDTLEETLREYYDVGTYEVKLTVQDSLGCRDDSVRNLQVVSLTSADEPDKENILVYPNPVSGEVFIKIPGLAGNDLTVILYNSYGEKIRIPYAYDEADQIRLQTDNLASGLYFLQLKLGNSVISVKKIIVY